VGNSRDFIKSSRVILIDRRGSGLSDRFRDAPTQETMLRDLEIVLDAAGSAKATLFGMWDGCETSTLFAATFPERVASLIFFTASAAPIDRLTQRHVDRYCSARESVRGSVVVSRTRGDEDRSYLEPIHGETLSAALDRELADVESLMRTPPRANPGYAAVRAGDRSAHISVVLAERPFGLTIWDVNGGFSQAHGWTSELREVAMVVRVFLENGVAPLSILAQSFPFLNTEPFVQNVDPHVTVEGRWQAMLLDSVPAIEERAAQRPDQDVLFHWPALAELIRRASERPELRCRQPFTSLWRFGLWQQFMKFDVPVAWATEDGYALTNYHGGAMYEGGLSAVLDAWIQRIAGWPESRLDGYWPER